MSDSHQSQNESRWRRKLIGGGAIGAALVWGLFSCGATIETADAVTKVSAQKSCRWRHKTDYRDNLDQQWSWTAGRVGCYAPVTALCLSIINVGTDYDDDTGAGFHSCRSKAKVDQFRPTAYDFGSSFSFSLVLRAGYVWSKGFKSSQTPNQGCRGLKTQRLQCINVHDSGIYLGGPGG